MPRLCQVTSALEAVDVTLGRRMPILSILDEHHHDVGQVVMIGTDARRLGRCSANLLARQLDVPFEAVESPEDVVEVNRRSLSCEGSRLILVDETQNYAEALGTLLGMNHLPNIVMHASVEIDA